LKNKRTERYEVRLRPCFLVVLGLDNKFFLFSGVAESSFGTEGRGEKEGGSGGSYDGWCEGSFGLSREICGGFERTGG
jgi:hypothetical protein